LRKLMHRTRIVELELSRPLAPLSGLEGYAAVLALVRLHGEPLGYARAPVSDGRCHLASLFDHFIVRHEREIVRALARRWTALPPAARAPLTAEDLPLLAHQPPMRQHGRVPSVSVAVCTRDRAEDLEQCIEALLRLDPAPLEIVVVDNAPATGDTRELVMRRYRDAVRYVLEPRPGLDWARNRAVLESRGDVIAFTDDDVIVERGWTGVIAETFAASPDVMAVTGLVAPAELESEAQHLFERYGGFGRGFRRRWCRRSDRPGSPRPATHGAGAYGTGANMAFRRTLFGRIGGFAHDLDVGTATNGGGDLEYFFRILREGFTLVYEPRAVVWHRHRRTIGDLHRQLRSWGTGFWAFMHYSQRRYPDEASAFHRFGRWWYFSFMGRKLWRAVAASDPDVAPAKLALTEVRGSFAGRGALRRARLQAQAAASAFPDEPSLPPAPPNTGGPPPEQGVHAPRTAVRSLELAAPFAPIAGLAGYRVVELHLTLHGAPVGRTSAVVEGDTLSVAQQRDVVGDYFADELRLAERNRVSSVLRRWLHALASNAENGAPQPSSIGTVSVVIATYDRPDDLRRCLRALGGQRTEHPCEVIVVDNHPQSGITGPVVAEFPFARYVAEPRAGLSYARNSGIRAATGAIVACTDDDALPDPNWIERLVAPFARQDVMVVTGNVLPVELETDAQHLFERYGGLGRGFDVREFGPEWFRGFRRAVRTWDLGATANAAIRASAFRHPAIGLFDEALGAGTPAPVGEDTYLFYRVLAAGFRVRYEPAAVVRHRHRREMSELRAQIFGYSAGHVAYNLTTWRRDRDRRGLLRVLVELPVHDVKQLARVVLRRAPYPVGMVLAEVAGHIAGPFAYWRALQRASRLGRSPSLVATQPDRWEREHAVPASDEREPADYGERVSAVAGGARRAPEPPVSG
jgi:GT2 family glycosyltransferase